MGIAFLFLVGGILIGLRAAPIVMNVATWMRARGSIGVAAMVFCLVMSVISSKCGLAPIIGAFAAGLVLARTEQSLHIERALKPVADLFIPIFFVCLGAAAELTRLSPFTPLGRSTLTLTFLLLGVAIIAKVAAGGSAPGRGFRRIVVGAGMIPRGEVALIFAEMGLSHRLLDSGQYTAIVGVVLGTILITPPLLRSLLKGGSDLQAMSPL